MCSARAVRGSSLHQETRRGGPPPPEACPGGGHEGGPGRYGSARQGKTYHPQQEILFFRFWISSFFARSKELFAPGISRQFLQAAPARREECCFPGARGTQLADAGRSCGVTLRSRSTWAALQLLPRRTVNFSALRLHPPHSWGVWGFARGPLCDEPGSGCRGEAGSVGRAHFPRAAFCPGFVSVPRARTGQSRICLTPLPRWAAMSSGHAQDQDAQDEGTENADGTRPGASPID